jgi:cytochrome c
MFVRFFVVVSMVFLFSVRSETVSPATDSARGATAFRQCVACHSLEPGVHLTGPSLAGIWGRKAGAADGFLRYSDAFKRSGIIWNEKTLEEFLKNPQESIPGNLMLFPGIEDEAVRADVVAYLRAVSTADNAERARRAAGAPMPLSNLKDLGKEQQVRSIRYCGDTYRVTTQAGNTIPFWEFNLRFKTDSTKNGPPKGVPALIRAGMMGDRAFLIFSSPEEISSMIERKC